MLLVHQGDRVGMGYRLDHHLAASRRLDRDRTVIVGDGDHRSRSDGATKFLLFLSSRQQRKKREDNQQYSRDSRMFTCVGHTPHSPCGAYRAAPRDLETSS